MPITHPPAATVLGTLKRLYEPPRTFLDWKTPLDLLIATILSAQCTDKRVNIVTTTLFRKHRHPEDYLRVSVAELEGDIHSCGTYRSKAKHIRALCALLLERHGGRVPRTMEELTALPGVGRKTANVVLWAAFGIIAGIAVDTHVLRLSRRLGLTQSGKPMRVELDLQHRFPRRDWGRLTPLLISHGRAVCTARNRQCEKCAFKKECPSSRVMGREDRASKAE